MHRIELAGQYTLIGIMLMTLCSVQLRGKADRRQVNGAKVAIQHNLGLGGAAIVTIYRKYGS